LIVGFVSQKGGVGKSTLSRALATSTAAAGTKVTIADLDNPVRDREAVGGPAGRVRRRV